MEPMVSILSTPEEALTIKNNIVIDAFIDPIEALCERSVTLCILFKTYLLQKQVVNKHAGNILWQLQGNVDLLDLYLKKYLAASHYNSLHHIILKAWQLLSDILACFASIQNSSAHPIKDIFKHIIRIKHLFISIKIYCYRIHRMS